MSFYNYPYLCCTHVTHIYWVCNTLVTSLSYVCLQTSYHLSSLFTYNQLHIPKSVWHMSLSMIHLPIHVQLSLKTYFPCPYTDILCKYNYVLSVGLLSLTLPQFDFSCTFNFLYKIYSQLVSDDSKPKCIIRNEVLCDQDIAIHLVSANTE